MRLHTQTCTQRCSNTHRQQFVRFKNYVCQIRPWQQRRHCVFQNNCRETQMSFLRCCQKLSTLQWRAWMRQVMQLFSSKMCGNIKSCISIKHPWLDIRCVCVCVCVCITLRFLIASLVKLRWSLHWKDCQICCYTVAKTFTKIFTRKAP